MGAYNFQKTEIMLMGISRHPAKIIQSDPLISPHPKSLQAL